MKKDILIRLLCLLSASASALNFFGIEHTGSTTDNVVNLIYSLAEDNDKAIDEYRGRLEKTEPALAKMLDPDDLKVPCSYCGGKGILDEERTCSVCQGTGLVTDAQALGYLYNKFCEALDAGKTEKKALREALEAFNQRRKLLPNREILTGTVLRKENGGALLSTEGDRSETVFLKGIGPEFPDEGAPVSGEVWLSGMYSYKAGGGKTVYTKCFAVTLWMD
jgi:hypothetical protein